MRQHKKENDNDKDQKLQQIKQIGAYLTIPFILAISPIIGWLIGSWLDKKLGTHPYFMYGCVILGFIAGFRELYRIIRQFGDNENGK